MNLWYSKRRPSATLALIDLWDRQTFSCFSYFCLPRMAELGRRTACFALFVCRGWLFPADGQLVLLFLSATAGSTRQTDTLFCPFCLPRMAGPGRRTPCFALFVCHGWLYPADGQLVLPFLSAADGWSRQTDTLFCPFCLPRQPYPADGQMILPFLSACAWKRQGPGLKNRGPCLLYWL